MGRVASMSAELFDRIKAGTIVLVGCGQMGGAMLRGWLASGAAEHFIVVEPAGSPAALATAERVAWHRDAQELPARLTPAAIVFAIKPQVMDAVLPPYRRWVAPQ